MLPAKTVTLRDIAERAGVSVMTVSRVLRKQRNISPATGAKVLQIARELGYRPNPLVSALMSYRRAAHPIHSFTTLGYITNFPTRNEWRQRPLLREFFEGAAQAADRHGYQLEEFWLREAGMSSAKLTQILYHRNIPGLIVAPLPVAHGHLRLDWDKFSAVTLGYSLARPKLHRAVNHQFHSLGIAMRQLREYGYRRIGLAMPASYDSRVDHQWSGSFFVEQQRSDAQHRVPMHLVEDRHWNQASFADWFLKNRPEVVMSQQAEILDWLRGLGVRVPEETGFVHLNCPDKSGQFAGIYQNGRVIGEAAIDFLVGMIHRNERGIPELPQFILVEGTWVDGATLKPKRRKQRASRAATAAAQA